jgi:hypothetical protein
MTQIAKRDKKIAMMTTAVVCVVCVIVAFIIVLNAVIIPNGKYRNAIALLDAGSFAEAHEAFVALNGYKDSADRADAAFCKYETEQLKAAKAGDYVLFGTYEQDNDNANGKENVEWLVLEVKEGKALIISKHALDCRPYNTLWGKVTWANSTIRKWLNDTFLHTAFSSAERAMIADKIVRQDKNPAYKTEPGHATMDKVFLLSIDEVNRYFGSDEARMCVPTAYAIANGAWTSDTYTKGDAATCWWWLRSPGYVQYNAAGVISAGSVSCMGSSVSNDCDGVRPALWIKLDS